MESGWRLIYSLSRVEIVSPEGGAKSSQIAPQNPADAQEFHERHGRQGVGLTQEGLTLSLNQRPSLQRPPHLTAQQRPPEVAEGAVGSSSGSGGTEERRDAGQDQQWGEVKAQEDSGGC